MIRCPTCDSDHVVLLEGVYPAELGVDYLDCQGCGKGFDVRITWEGVELAPVFYGGTGP